jgi:hypothetical protein
MTHCIRLLNSYKHFKAAHLPQTKLMAFIGRDPVRTKIVIDNKIIEQVKSLKYLGNMISYEREFDIDNKLNSYLKVQVF